MNLLDFFRPEKVECPRCLGKGIVDEADLKRLNREFIWGTGTCAYCEGIGKVSDQVLRNVAPDEMYLGSNLPKEERIRLRNGDNAATERAKNYNIQIIGVAEQIRFLSKNAGLSSSQIHEFFLMPKTALNASTAYQTEIKVFIEKVLKHT